MTTRTMTDKQYKEFPGKMMELTECLKEGMYKYSKKHNGVDLTVLGAALGSVAKHVCDAAEEEHKAGANYKDHVIGVFTTIVKNV